MVFRIFSEYISIISNKKIKDESSKNTRNLFLNLHYCKCIYYVCWNYLNRIISNSSWNDFSSSLSSDKSY